MHLIRLAIVQKSESEVFRLPLGPDAEKIN